MSKKSTFSRGKGRLRTHQILCQIGKEVERGKDRVDMVHDVSKAVRKKHSCQQKFLQEERTAILCQSRSERVLCDVLDFRFVGHKALALLVRRWGVHGHVMSVRVAPHVLAERSSAQISSTSAAERGHTSHTTTTSR